MSFNVAEGAGIRERTEQETSTIKHLGDWITSMAPDVVGFNELNDWDQATFASKTNHVK